jgi:hypothetical protein
MEAVADNEIADSLGLPTATPALDVLRPSPHQEPERLSTGDYFFVSSAVIIAFTGLPYIRAFVDTISNGSFIAFWISLLGLPLFTLFLAVASHHAGHLVAARMTGFEAVRIKFGPITILEKLEATDVLSLGFVVLRPGRAERLRRRLCWLVLAGPLASLLLPLLLEGALRLAQTRWGALHFLVTSGVHLFLAVSLLLGISSLLPDIDSAGNFSDGTRLLMLLKSDFRGQRLIALLRMQLGLNSGEHPRGWGEDLVVCALASKDESFDTVAANWLAYLWATGRQDLTQATRYLEEALIAVAASPGHLRDRIFLEAAIFQAWYRHNLVKARLWESQIQNPDSLPPLERKRLEIASCWAQGRSFDAFETLQQHLKQVRELPASPLRTSAERDALEWKAQMESRMLAGAWATMHSWPYERQTQVVV